MDGFILTLTNFLLSAGVPQNHIHVKKSLTVIPGFFRPTKMYDFLVVNPEKPQLKVLILPSPKGTGILEESKYELSKAKSKRLY